MLPEIGVGLAHGWGSRKLAEAKYDGFLCRIRQKVDRTSKPAQNQAQNGDTCTNLKQRSQQIIQRYATIEQH